MLVSSQQKEARGISSDCSGATWGCWSEVKGTHFQPRGTEQLGQLCVPPDRVSLIEITFSFFLFFSFIFYFFLFYFCAGAAWQRINAVSIISNLLPPRRSACSSPGGGRSSPRVGARWGQPEGQGSAGAARGSGFGGGSPRVGARPGITRGSGPPGAARGSGLGRSSPGPQPTHGSGPGVSEAAAGPGRAVPRFSPAAAGRGQWARPGRARERLRRYLGSPEGPGSPERRGRSSRVAAASTGRASSAAPMGTGRL